MEAKDYISAKDSSNLCTPQAQTITGVTPITERGEEVATVRELEHDGSQSPRSDTGETKANSLVNSFNSTEATEHEDGSPEMPSKKTSVEISKNVIPAPNSMSKRAMKRKLRREKYEAMKNGTDLSFKKKPKVNNSPGFEDDCLKETDYYFENGLRKVYPYYFNFTTYAKERWYGRTLFDVFTTEFRYDPKDYVRDCIQCGKMKVNAKAVDMEYVLKNGDLITHTIHRHENHVTGSKIEIIEASDDFVVVNKPSSIPIHPCGRYRHNTLMFILGKEYGFKNLRTLYRLDRLTSGVFIMGYSQDKIRKICDQISKRQVTKEYLCRVEGHFPDGTIECHEPLDVISHKIGLQHVSPDGKPSSTSFQKLSYNGVTSLVKCIPKTGRTHQIRVHLQYLGFPIINDPFYNSTVWGPEKGKHGCFHKTREQLLEDISQFHASSNWVDPCDDKKTTEADQASSNAIPGAKTDNENVVGDNVEEESLNSGKSSNGVMETEASASATTGDTGAYSKSVDVKSDHKTKTVDDVRHVVLQEDCVVNEPSCKKLRTESEAACSSEEILCVRGPVFDSDKYILDEDCATCKMRYKDPSPESLVMYLHALSYKGPGWEFSTSIPYWAKDDWTT